MEGQTALDSFGSNRWWSLVGSGHHGTAAARHASNSGHLAACLHAGLQIDLARLV